MVRLWFVSRVVDRARAQANKGFIEGTGLGETREILGHVGLSHRQRRQQLEPVHDWHPREYARLLLDPISLAHCLT